MRTIGLLALAAALSCLPAHDARAQGAAGTSGKQTVQTTQTSAGQAAAELAGRPDAWRYYWHNGMWWYLTPQNTWLRWNGGAWVQHYSMNESGAFSQGFMQQPNSGAVIVAPGYDNGGVAIPSYRYDINRRKGGL